MSRRRSFARIILSGERARKGVNQVDHCRIKWSHVALLERARRAGHDEPTSVLIAEIVPRRHSLTTFLELPLSRLVGVARGAQHATTQGLNRMAEMHAPLRFCFP